MFSFLFVCFFNIRLDLGVWVGQWNSLLKRETVDDRENITKKSFGEAGYPLLETVGSEKRIVEVQVPISSFRNGRQDHLLSRRGVSKAGMLGWGET